MGDGVWLHGATFGNYVRFDRTTFGNDVRFDDSTFGALVCFDETTFGDRASFVDVACIGASFEGAVFGAHRPCGDGTWSLAYQAGPDETQKQTYAVPS